VAVARLAEACGVKALTIHGRTRACGFSGAAEYDTIAAVKAALRIPVIANGDIDSPQKAHRVLAYTGADAVMVGRAAQGRPWIFTTIDHYLRTGEILPEPSPTDIRDLMLEHLQRLYEFYGEYKGILIARKHLSWYSKRQPAGAVFRQRVNQVVSAEQQITMTRDFFDRLAEHKLGIAA